MIKKVGIKNFKSVVDLTMELGRFNVVIGSNGCGKTNILEAITLASAASQNKLDNEFLGTRLRNVPAPYMFSAFEDIESQEMIKVFLNDEWQNSSYEFIYGRGKWWSRQPDYDNTTNFNKIGMDDKSIWIKFNNDERDSLCNQLLDNIKCHETSIGGFLIYSPEETKLRTFSDENYIYPFGRKGEGLFQHLKHIVEKKDLETIKSINEGLMLLDWFDGFSIPNDLMSTEYRLSIGDKYLKDSLHNFDQRSTNEGFLYLLFYLTLFNSKETPRFFGIDNIEASFNPRLCTKLTEELVGLSKKNDKQVIVTTHNPYVLDGLDLSDDEVRLFVARRDIDGHTRIERIQYREERKMLLSELWMSGLIGGLPENF